MSRAWLLVGLLAGCEAANSTHTPEPAPRPTQASRICAAWGHVLTVEAKKRHYSLSVKKAIWANVAATQEEISVTPAEFDAARVGDVVSREADLLGPGLGYSPGHVARTVVGKHRECTRWVPQ